MTRCVRAAGYAKRYKVGSSALLGMSAGAHTTMVELSVDTFSTRAHSVHQRVHEILGRSMLIFHFVGNWDREGLCWQTCPPGSSPDMQHHLVKGY